MADATHIVMIRYGGSEKFDDEGYLFTSEEDALAFSMFMDVEGHSQTWMFDVGSALDLLEREMDSLCDDDGAYKEAAALHERLSP